MALGFATNLRNARLDAITTFAGSAAILRIYSGTQPATGGAVTTLLAEAVCGTPFAGSASAGVLTLTVTSGVVGQDVSADASGTATWFRLFKSDGSTIVMDGSINTVASGLGDLRMPTNVITAGQPVQITSFTITEANA